MGKSHHMTKCKLVKDIWVMVREINDNEPRPYDMLNHLLSNNARLIDPVSPNYFQIERLQRRFYKGTQEQVGVLALFAFN